MGSKGRRKGKKSSLRGGEKRRKREIGRDERNYHERRMKAHLTERKETTRGTKPKGGLR